MRVIRSALMVTGVLAATILGASSNAWASTVSSTDGAVATYNTSGNFFHLCDTANDGHAVYVDWRGGGQSGRFQHAFGNGQCRDGGTGVPDGVTLFFKACENINNLRDQCDDEESTTA